MSHAGTLRAPWKIKGLQRWFRSLLRLECHRRVAARPTLADLEDLCTSCTLWRRAGVMIYSFDAKLSQVAFFELQKSEDATEGVGLSIE